MNNESNVSIAMRAWGAPPDWVLQLAKLCDEKSQTAAARDIGYSNGTVNQVINNKWTSGTAKIEAAVRGLLMNQNVNCPVLGEIATHTCIETQRRPFRPTNSTRVQLYKACRAGCPNFKGHKSS